MQSREAPACERDQWVLCGLKRAQGARQSDTPALSKRLYGLYVNRSNSLCEPLSSVFVKDQD